MDGGSGHRRPRPFSWCPEGRPTYHRAQVGEQETDADVKGATTQISVYAVGPSQPGRT